MPTVSVLIACRDGARTLGDTLASVAAQTLPDVETIVVDDASRDGSAALARAHGVRVLAGVGRGPSAARNLALDAARGRAILFLDADDVIAPTHLEALWEAIGPSDAFVGLSPWVRFAGNPWAAKAPPRTTDRSAGGIDWLLADWSDGLPMTQCGMFLVPRALLDRHGGWDEALSLGDDFEFFCRILARSAGVRFAPRACLYYRESLGPRLSATRERSALASSLAALERGTRHVLAIEDSARTRCAVADICLAFDTNHYPVAPDLRARARARAAALGGGRRRPLGPPPFHKLRRLLGWRLARRLHAAIA